MNRHFLKLEDAATVRTTSFHLAQRAVADLLEAQAMGVIHGDAGLGKSFAVDFAVRRTNTEYCWVEFPPRSTMKQITETLLSALTGLEHRGERLKLSRDLLGVLSEEPRLVVVDEAQRLNAECVEYLRYLHDDPATSFALVLVGGNGCWEVLSRHPMLEARVFRRVAFQPMKPEHVLKAIPNYHGIYADADRELLLRVDELFAHGNFRRWASFTKTAAAECREQELQSLTEEIVEFVFALHGGGAVAA